MNQSQWSKKFTDGNCRFLTKRLWGAANEPPFFHHGLFTTLRQVGPRARRGSARVAQAFQALPADEQDALIEFLKTLQVLPPGTKARIVDENMPAAHVAAAVDTTHDGHFRDRKMNVAAPVIWRLSRN